MRDQRTSEDLQVLSNVLEDTPASDVTRRRLLQTAAAGAAVSAGALSATGVAGAAGESPKRILSTLATAESFGVTFLTEAIGRAPGTPRSSRSTARSRASRRRRSAAAGRSLSTAASRRGASGPSPA